MAGSKAKPPTHYEDLADLPVLVELASQMGNVAGQVSQINERMGGVEDRLRSLERRFDEWQPPDKPEGESPDESLSFARKWLPWLFAGGVTVAGAIWGVIERLSKGGNSTP